jgi:N-methylhydantoinase A
LTYKISFDVGGTFTDFTMLDELSGTVAYHKVSSTPHDPSEAIAQGLEDLIRMHRLDPSAITLLGHGTTVATNLVIERKGARVGLVTTRGFRDVLEIGRQTRPHLYNYRIHRPTPLVARALRLEVEERVMADGRVLTPLNMADLEKAGELFRKAGVTAIAICFLHSYREPAHERRAGEALRQMLPEAYITLSSDVLPEFREFERMSTTVLNAYMGPRMGTYMERLLKRVEAIGIAAEINTVHSNGGLMSVQTVREVPVRTCVSGPAAGVIGTAVVGSMAGYENLVTFDVGGTSTDVSVIVKGRALYASNRLVADYPVKTPMLDIHVIGAGGGSIARIDDAGALKVGPHSAGADPGPAAYGRGGLEATITDANIVLGRLDPHFLLNGKLAVDFDAARNVIERKVAQPLGISIDEAAHGIVRIANANMNRAIQSVSTERGYDIREFALMAFGGAGPLHATELAKDCGIQTVIVPLEPGTFCARGILLSDITMDFVRSELSVANESAWQRVCTTLADMQKTAIAWLEREGVAPERRQLRLSIETRFDGQNYEVIVPLEGIDPNGLSAFLASFRTRHLQEYGYDIEGRETEIVNCRVQAVGQVPKTAQRFLSSSHSPIIKSERSVYFGAVHGRLPTPVYERSTLAQGYAIEGPAIVEEMSSTTILLPDQKLQVDSLGSLIIAV